MKKDMMALVKVGIVYVAVSMVLDFFFGSYQILLWPALAFEFIIFGVLIFSSLPGSMSPRTTRQLGSTRSTPEIENDLTLLEHLCKAAIDQADPNAEDRISARVRALAFAVAANNLNTSEAVLRAMVRERPDLLQSKIKDPQLLRALTTSDSVFQKGDTHLGQLLEKIEEWMT